MDDTNMEKYREEMAKRLKVDSQNISLSLVQTDKKEFAVAKFTNDEVKLDAVDGEYKRSTAKFLCVPMEKKGNLADAGMLYSVESREGHDQHINVAKNNTSLFCGLIGKEGQTICTFVNISYDKYFDISKISDPAFIHPLIIEETDWRKDKNMPMVRGIFEQTIRYPGDKAAQKIFQLRTRVKQAWEKGENAGKLHKKTAEQQNTIVESFRKAIGRF